MLQIVLIVLILISISKAENSLRTNKELNLVIKISSIILNSASILIGIFSQKQIETRITSTIITLVLLIVGDNINYICNKIIEYKVKKKNNL